MKERHLKALKVLDIYQNPRRASQFFNTRYEIIFTKYCLREGGSFIRADRHNTLTIEVVLFRLVFKELGIHKVDTQSGVQSKRSNQDIRSCTSMHANG